MSAMYVITVEFVIEPKRSELFRVAILTQARNSLSKEPGCRQFDVCFDEARPERCFLYEKYDDEAAFVAHRKTAHFAEYASTVEPWILSKTLSVWTQADLDS
jgi:quinol monooxygenase YgiN